MSERPWLRRADETLLVTASLLGTLPVAVSACITLARFFPMDEEDRFTLGFVLVIPCWVAAMCVVVLSRSGVRAWILCAALALAAGGWAEGNTAIVAGCRALAPLL